MTIEAGEPLAWALRRPESGTGQRGAPETGLPGGSSHPGRQLGQSAQEWIRIHNAAVRARRRYPGAVGELVARELSAYAELGWLHGAASLPERLIDDVLAAGSDPGPTTTSTRPGDDHDHDRT